MQISYILSKLLLHFNEVVYVYEISAGYVQTVSALPPALPIGQKRSMGEKLMLNVLLLQNEFEVYSQFDSLLLIILLYVVSFLYVNVIEVLSNKIYEQSMIMFYHHKILFKTLNFYLDRSFSIPFQRNLNSIHNSTPRQPFPPYQFPNYTVNTEFLMKQSQYNIILMYAVIFCM